MGIRALCAAAAVVAGVGAAEAATYDVIFTLTQVQHDYDPFEGDGTTTFLSEWRGMVVNTPLRGVLEYGDDIFPVLTVGASILFGERDFASQDASGGWTEQNSGWLYNYLTWNGSEGTWLRKEDHLPDFYDIHGEFRLAAVPLPATAALLPLGIGALALMRRRRGLS